MAQPPSLLVTGHLGFVGQALRAYLQRHPDAPARWCEPARQYDVGQRAEMDEMIVVHRPDWIIHLAAQSHVPQSWQDPAATLQANVCGTANLLAALDAAKFSGRLLHVSSADVYGAVPEDALPVTEERLPQPRNPYASSKVAAEVLCLQWARTRPLDLVVARPFNHTGPGQRPDFALPAFAREVAAVRLGLQPPRIAVGDIEVTRDFLAVDDVVEAYLLLLAKGQAGETYNVCSGRETRLSEALAALLELAGVQAEVRVDPGRLRRAEQRRMCGSHQKLTQATGWTPRTPLRDTLSALLNHWTQELQA